MKIEINKKQYEELVHSLQVAESIYALLRDVVDREKYDKKLKQIENLSEYILKFVDDYGVTDITEEFEDKRVISENYLNAVLDDIRDYDEHAFWEELVSKLAEREFFNTYSEKQIKDMNEMERIHKHMEIEDKYWKEFEKNGFDKIILKK